MRTAVVVGATSAIGSAVADGLAGAGWSVAPWRRPDGGRIELTDPAQVDAAAAAYDRLGAVVYAAGLFDRGDADVADPDGWARRRCYSPPTSPRPSSTRSTPRRMPA